MSGPRRWLGYAALVLVFSTVCGLLSWWQFARNEEAAERIRQVVDNWDRAPGALGDVLAAPDAAFDPADTWTPVRLTGEYAVEEQLLVRGRPRDGRPGFEVLVPLRIDGGGTLVVDRGWVPVGQSQAEVPDEVPAPPSGPIEVIVRLKIGEPAVPGRSAPEGQVATIELPQVAALLPGDAVYTGAYGLLDSERTATGDVVTETPALAKRPEPDPGPHLSYAVQWILFAVMAAGALIWSILNERKARRLTAEELVQRDEARAVRRRDEDAVAEDALLDR